MAINKYANFDLATGNDDGTTKADAFQTFASLAASALTAGDEIACTGTDTAGGSISGSASLTKGVRLISYDSTLTTPEIGSCILDGQDSVAKVLTIAAQGLISFEGWTIKNATDNCIDCGSGDGASFVNCMIHDATNEVIDGSNESVTFQGCEIYNGAHGIYSPGANTQILNCIIHTITSYGIYFNAQGITIINNLIYDCGLGIQLNNSTGTNTVIMFNTIDGCAGNALVDLSSGHVSYPNTYRFNRFTNNGGYGIEQSSLNGSILANWNAFYNNSFGAKNIAGSLIGGENDVNMSSDGYTNRTAKNFTLTDSAEARRYTVSVGNDTTNISYPPAGVLVPTDSSSGSGGGTKSRFGEILGIKRGII